jgi:membrane protein
MRFMSITRQATLAFFAHDNLSRGAAIAFYAVTSLAPVLLIVIAVCGLFFGETAAQQGIASQLNDLLGPQGADLTQAVIAASQSKTSGSIATIVGLLTVIVTASGVFGEMHTALNIIWDGNQDGASILSLIRTRAASLGLVAALGFLLIVSLVASAAVSALSTAIQTKFSAMLIVSTVNISVSFLIFTFLFCAIYKLLPDRPIAWRDVLTGSCVTALLFIGGKSAIGWYLGRAAVGSTYGAAGALIVLLFWTYYSAQIFLIGAEITKAVADHRIEGGNIRS